MTDHGTHQLSPDDADVALIVDYLSQALSEAEADAVTTRLATDPEFFAKAQPLIRVWTAPVNFAALAAQIDREEAAQAPRPARRRTLKRVLWQIAASIAAVLVWPVYQAGVLAVGYNDAVQLGTRDVKAPSTAVGQFVSTRQNESRVVWLSGDSRVTMRGQSRLTYKRMQGWPGALIVTLKGEAVFEVHKSDVAVFLGTMNGSAVLLPGTYAVRCELGCTGMRVTVGPRGTAWINGWSLTTWARLRAGQHGEVRPPSDPVHTTGYQYPEIKP